MLDVPKFTINSASVVCRTVKEGLGLRVRYSGSVRPGSPGFEIRCKQEILKKFYFLTPVKAGPRGPHSLL